MSPRVNNEQKVVPIIFEDHLTPLDQLTPSETDSRKVGPDIKVKQVATKFPHLVITPRPVNCRSVSQDGLYLSKVFLKGSLGNHKIVFARHLQPHL
ncbi:hypothetical protein OUZ56_029898 [Daphnia magna]|uniref:Uncharacterized protein n=1 Tax=Daphnia magna TaxID=35525 RepID=A0ABR0B865_9CRUS|nr:hypothetical protein OUZ56_029898 [Daphnia magna]